MLSYNIFMTELEEYYQQTFLTPFIKDRCIHCHRLDVIQMIIQMEINGETNQGPYCRSCYLDQAGMLKYWGVK